MTIPLLGSATRPSVSGPTKTTVVPIPLVRTQIISGGQNVKAWVQQRTPSCGFGEVAPSGENKL